MLVRMLRGRVCARTEKGAGMGGSPILAWWGAGAQHVHELEANTEDGRQALKSTTPVLLSLLSKHHAVCLLRIPKNCISMLFIFFYGYILFSQY